MRQTRTFTEKYEDLKRKAINRYLRLMGDKAKESREELEMMGAGRLMRLVDHAIAVTRDKTLRCGQCVHLYPYEYAMRMGYQDNPFYQRCDHFVNPLWKDPGKSRARGEFVRRPHNKACPNFEAGMNEYTRKRQEKANS